jgi:hypothetical protein
MSVWTAVGGTIRVSGVEGSRPDCHCFGDVGWGGAMTLLDLAWRDFSVITTEVGTGREILEALRSESLTMALLHDTLTSRSFVVDVEQLAVLVEAWPDFADTRIMDTPVVAVLAAGQLTAREDFPPSLVIGMALWQNAGLVIVEDEAHLPVGLVSPLNAVSRLLDVEMEGSAAGSDHEWASEAMNVVRTVELGERPGIPSESMRIAPAAPYCSGGSGHWVARCPCTYHPEATCRIRTPE